MNISLKIYSPLDISTTIASDLVLSTNQGKFSNGVTLASSKFVTSVFKKEDILEFKQNQNNVSNYIPPRNAYTNFSNSNLKLSASNVGSWNYGEVVGETPTFPLLDAQVTNSLGGDPSCLFSLVLGDTFKTPVASGDIIEFFMDDYRKFTGYIKAFNVVTGSNGVVISVSSSSLLSRIKDISFLYKVASQRTNETIYGSAVSNILKTDYVNTVASFQRSISQAIVQATDRTFAEYCNIYYDMNSESKWTGVLDTTSDCYSMLEKVSNTYVRTITSRANSDIYLYQPYGSKFTVDNFSIFDFSDIKEYEDVSYKEDYSLVNRQTVITYTNSAIIANGFIVGSILFNYRYPNIDTYFANTKTVPAMLPSTNMLEVYNSDFTVPSKVESVYTLQTPTVDALLGGVDEIQASKLQSKLKLDLLKNLYDSIKGLEILTISGIAVDDITKYLDAGDSFRYEGKMYVVESASTQLSGTNASVDISMTPLVLYNPPVIPIPSGAA
jgi:hypothetical protein